ncbi:MAG: arabinan endo-1,5-alpha-L-arabinosidase [Bacteroidales bacterium]|nr:arabinan endo-1,5-alpha-L-arabinosidase [Bacteroidales bacterium]
MGPRFDSLAPAAHDPVAAFCDGSWYLFCTGFGVSILTSDDLLSWNPAGQVFDKAPQWAVETVPGYMGHTWAPDILFHDGTYYLYYSCSSFGKNTSAIGVATNKTLNPSSPDYKWTDHGCVVRSIAGRDEWNAIDPNVFIDDDGTAYLSFGSFWRDIKMVKLDPSLTKVAEPQEWFPICRRPEGTAEDTSQTDDAIKADPRGHDFDPGNGAVEAPFIVKRNGKYYLFVSYDLCCRGAKSTYKVVVGRSDKATGPFFDKNGVSLMEGGGTVVVSGNDQYPGVGHCAVISTPEGDKMLMHAYNRDKNYNANLLVRTIKWDSEGWPVVNL